MVKISDNVSKNLAKLTENSRGTADNKGRGNKPSEKRGPKIHVDYHFATSGVDPYTQVKWEKRDVVMTNWKTGGTTFEQRGVEFPDFWSVNATNIVTSKYFHGVLGSATREDSLKQLIDRVVGKYVEQSKIDDVFDGEESRTAFANDLKYLLVHQMFSFNSPVWFNVGTEAPQQVSACFILGVDDNMDSILNWYVEEGKIFKRGSGAGVNLSRIRGSNEGLRHGGHSSGPVSFMRGADASAGTIASGGATRRAAKMVILDVDHPDIESFIQTKVREEEKIRALRDAGFDMGIDGQDIYSAQYQNANNSVRVSDEFMKAVESDGKFDLRNRLDGSVSATVDAKKLFYDIAQAAWACADPGLQYDDTINAWHTLAAEGKIVGSNPCSEYMSIDNSSCNLASINLLKFLDEDNKFNVEQFERAAELIFTAMDLSISFGDFPTEKIGVNTKKFRQLGIGYANLGALLMAIGLPYDSPQGQNVAAAITSLMTGTAYRRSAELAGAVGPFAGFAKNRDSMTNVIRKHTKASLALTDKITDVDHHINAEDIVFAANREWDASQSLGQQYGWRNSQASLLAPTGTIGFMMDCDTTGIEPDFSLVKFKKMVDGSNMQIVNLTIPRALKHLGYRDDEITDITDYILKNGNVIDAPHLRKSDYAIFDTAVGLRSIAPMGHVRMMAAVQPFLSGAISKTVNMPESATVEDVGKVYLDSWKLGLKAVAIYRDNCKAYQPLSDKKDDKTDDESESKLRAKIERELRPKIEADVRAELTATPNAQSQQTKLFDDAVLRGHKISLPSVRDARTYKYDIGGMKSFATIGKYGDGKIGELFMRASKQGSTLAGLFDAFSIAVSMGLQYGVPLEKFVEKFANMRFEPSGMTSDHDIPFASSPLDYLFRRLALDNLSFDERSQYGIYTTAERAHAIENGGFYEEVTEVGENLTGFGDQTNDQPTKKDEQAEADFARIKADKAESIKFEKTYKTVAEPTTPHSASIHSDLKSDPGASPAVHSTAELMDQLGASKDAPMCLNCGVKMRPAGSCYICELCGSTSGCS
ncbi:MAG: vitamin B12-dependent ribonucleotide reductase [Candidatus Nanoperiomorbaceae bacterium]